MRFLDFAAGEAYDPGMMRSAWLAIVVLLAGTGWVQAQSLAELARIEAARRQTAEGPAKVYTNDSLRPDPNQPMPPPAASGSVAEEGESAADPKPAPPAAASQPTGAVRDQAYWSKRLSEARANVDRSQAFAQALQNRVDMLWTDFVNRGDPVQQREIEQDRNKTLAELERVKREVADHQKVVTAIEDEARREGVPAGWLRR